MADQKIIKINCEGVKTMPLDELLDFQGELKELSDEDFKKFKTLILTYGFTSPIHIWRQKKKDNTVTVTNFIIDGHQRCKVLKYLRDSEGYKVDDLPIVYVDAPTRKVAKEILLSHVSTYGKVTRQGLDMFMMEAGLEMQDLGDMLSIDNMSFDDFDEEPELKEETITPYSKVNILISFPPALFAKVSPILEKIFEIEGVEYEQSSI